MQTPDVPAVGQPPGAASPGRLGWRGAGERARRFLFGYDVFVSYARADALEYAQGLADALIRRRVAAYVDQLGTPPGPEMPPLLLLRLRLSSMLVLIASPGAAASVAVRQEVEEFSRRNHRIFAVDVAGALDGAEWYRGWIKGAPARRITLEELASGDPSGPVVDHILKNIDFARREDRLRRVMRNLLAGIAVLLVVGAGASLFALHQNGQAAQAKVRELESNQRAQSAEGNARTQEARAGAAANSAREARMAFSAADSLRTQAEAAAQAAAARAVALNRTADALGLARQAVGAFDDTGEGLTRSLLLSLESLRTEWTMDGFAAWQRAMALLPQPLARVQAHGSAITAMAVSGDGQRLATADGRGEIRVWEVRERGDGLVLAPASASGMETRIRVPKKVEALAWDRDGTMLATAYADSITVWALGASRARRVASVSVFPAAFGLAFSPDGRWLAAAAWGSIYLLEPAGGTPVRLEHSLSGAISIAFSPDGQLLAVGGLGLDLLNVSTGARYQAPGSFAQGDHPSVAFSPDGTSVSAGGQVWWVVRGDGGGVALTEEPEREPGLHTAPYMRAVGFARERAYVVQVEEGFASVDDLVAGREVSRIPHPDNAHSNMYRRNVVFAPGARWVAFGNERGELVVYPGTPRNEVARIRHGARVRSSDFSADGRWLVTASDDHMVRIFGTDGWREVRRLPGAGTLARFSPDGRWLAALGDSSLLRFEPGSWRSRSVPRVPFGDGMVDNLEFSPDGWFLAARGFNWCGRHRSAREVRVWSAATGEEAAWEWAGCSTEYMGQVSAPRAGGVPGLLEKAGEWIDADSARNRDGRWLAWIDGTEARLVDAASRRAAADLWQAGEVNDVALSPDGRWAATAGEDGILRLWLLGPAEEMVRAACARLPRNFTRAEWARYFGTAPYRATCPGLPIPRPTSAAARPPSE